MNLFIRLFLDEDVDVLLAELLRSRGFYAETTQDAQRKGATDRSQIEYCTRQNLTLFTHNRVDFENLATELFERGIAHPGLIIAHRKPVHAMLPRLLDILNDVSSDEISNQIRYI